MRHQTQPHGFIRQRIRELKGRGVEPYGNAFVNATSNPDTRVHSTTHSRIEGTQPHLRPLAACSFSVQPTETPSTLRTQHAHVPTDVRSRPPMGKYKIPANTCNTGQTFDTARAACRMRALLPQHAHAQRTNRTKTKQIRNSAKKRSKTNYTTANTEYHVYVKHHRTAT